MKEKIKELLKELFADGALLYASSGRINLIGEHTDYNGGFVFPGAIDKCIKAKIKENGTEIDGILPPMSRFGKGGGNRSVKKTTVLDKLKAFFEKYFGLGIIGFGKKEEQ